MTVKTAILTFALALPRAVCAADVLVTEGLRADRRAGQIVPASESTMPTPRTLGTRTAPTGQTNCSGTFVDLTSDDNNCGSCGTVCPPATPACISSVCTIP